MNANPGPRLDLVRPGRAVRRANWPEIRYVGRITSAAHPRSGWILPTGRDQAKTLMPLPASAFATGQANGRDSARLGESLRGSRNDTLGLHHEPDASCRQADRH